MDGDVAMKEVDTKTLVQSNTRANALLVTVICAIVGCMVVVVLPMLTINQYAQGIITLILGKYLGMFEQAFQFEFGLTRSAAKKDDTIKQLTTAAAATAAAGTVTTTVTTPAPAAPIVADNVNVQSQTAVVTEQPKP